MGSCRYSIACCFDSVFDAVLERPTRESGTEDAGEFIQEFPTMSRSHLVVF